MIILPFDGHAAREFLDVIDPFFGYVDDLTPREIDRLFIDPMTGDPRPFEYKHVDRFEIVRSDKIVLVAHSTHADPYYTYNAQAAANCWYPFTTALVERDGNTIKIEHHLEIQGIWTDWDQYAYSIKYRTNGKLCVEINRREIDRLKTDS